MRAYLESQAHPHLGFQRYLWVLEVIRDTKVKREKRGTLVLLDFQGGQDLWAQKVSRLWVHQVLPVLLACLELLVSDDLVLVGPLALLDPQDLHLPMDPLSVSPALLGLLVHQDMPTQ